MGQNQMRLPNKDGWAHDNIKLLHSLFSLIERWAVSQWQGAVVIEETQPKQRRPYLSQKWSDFHSVKMV